MSYTFAVGDIHGCAVQMNELIEAIEFAQPEGTIVFVGDYIDRGPDSRGVIERLMAGPRRPGWRWIMLKGNHEEMMVSACRVVGNPTMWLVNGGEETLLSFGDRVPDDVLDWANALPLYHQDEHRIYVHAGVDDTVPLAQHSEQILLWRRPAPGETGRYWGKHLVHGHTPSDENPHTDGNRTNIDSACVFGGTLTAAVFDDAIAGPPLSFIRVVNRTP